MLSVFLRCKNPCSLQTQFSGLRFRNFQTKPLHKKPFSLCYNFRKFCFYPWKSISIAILNILILIQFVRLSFYSQIGADVRASFILWLFLLTKITLIRKMTFWESMPEPLISSIFSFFLLKYKGKVYLSILQWNGEGLFRWKFSVNYNHIVAPTASHKCTTQNPLGAKKSLVVRWIFTEALKSTFMDCWIFIRQREN